jgi:hypothetical protein
MQRRRGVGQKDGDYGEDMAVREKREEEERRGEDTSP